MEIKANEISSLIKEEIKEFNKASTFNKSLGTVVEVGDGIAIIYGLKDVILGELLEFKEDVFGMVMNLDEDSLSAVLLGDANKVKEGEMNLLAVFKVIKENSFSFKNVYHSIY